jgi:hypothetical protein
MARSVLGAIGEMFRQKFSSSLNRDVTLELEAGPASDEELSRTQEELRRLFPNMTSFAAGGDPERSWKIAVSVTPSASADELCQELEAWVARNRPFIRKHSLRRRSLWGTA